MGNRRKISNKFNTDFDLSIFKSVLQRYWLVFPILMLLAGITGFIYLRYTKPKYESIAVIQRSSQDEGKRILDIDNFENENNLSEDVELLRSKFLLEKALRNLNLNVSYYSEGEILTEEKYLFSSYHITLKELRDSSLIGRPIDVKNEGNTVSLSFQSNSGQQMIPVVLGEDIDNEFFALSFKISKPELFKRTSSENRLYFTFNDYKQLTDKLHPQLNVFALNVEARTIQISFQSNNSRLAQDIVASLINTFFQYDLEKKSQSSANILAFIETQLDTVFLQLKDSENRIQQFKDSSKVNDPTLYTQRILNNVSELNKELMQTDLDYQLLLEVESSVEENDRIEIYNLMAAIAGTQFDNILKGELNVLHDLLEEKEDITYSHTMTSDAYKKVTNRIESQTQNIKRSIVSFKKQLNFKKRNLEDRIYSLESQLYGVPAKEMELSRLNRMFNLNEKYYTLLIEKKTQYSISKAGYTMDNMVLQYPTRAVLISPNKKFVYVVLFVLALLISIIYILIRYITFNEINSDVDLLNILPENLSFLGNVPKIKSETEASELIIDRNPKSVLAESFRHIRSNLQFILNQNQSNLIAVSSSVSGEGKTFIALNLGGILNLTGKKVILLDLDLRKPKVHKGFNVENEKGMSNLLAGHMELDEVIQNTQLEGYDFITAGPIPPNPSELILSEKFNLLIEELKKIYDFVIIDNPPVGIVSDGVAVLKKADCPIYVFRANYSKRIFANRINELIHNQSLTNLNVVLNGVKLGKKGYGYGYGYGEYYNQEENNKKRFFKR